MAIKNLIACKYKQFSIEYVRFKGINA